MVFFKANFFKKMLRIFKTNDFYFLQGNPMHPTPSPSHTYTPTKPWLWVRKDNDFWFK